MSSFHNAVFPSFTEGSFTRGEGGGHGRMPRATSVHVVYRLAALTQQIQDGGDDVGENVQVAGSNLNTANKNMCGEGSGGPARWMIQREAPLRPGGSVVGGGLLFRKYALQSAARR